MKLADVVFCFCITSSMGEESLEDLSIDCGHGKVTSEYQVSQVRLLEY